MTFLFLWDDFCQTHTLHVSSSSSAEDTSAGEFREDGLPAGVSCVRFQKIQSRLTAQYGPILFKWKAISTFGSSQIDPDSYFYRRKQRRAAGSPAERDMRLFKR